ncbi:MAG: hypothetical protein ABUK01_18630 [Leptospirales bacterium]
MKKGIILLLAISLFKPINGYGDIGASLGGALGASSAEAFIAASTYSVVGITITVLGVITTIATVNAKGKKSKEELVRYMKSNHVNLVRDISMGRGPMITDWGAELNLTRVEQKRLEYRLEGSIEQIEMLQALFDEIEIEDAEAFSKALVNIILDVIGDERLVAIGTAQTAY